MIWSKSRDTFLTDRTQARIPPHVFSDAFVPDIAAAMFVETITWWLEHGQPYTPKEMATRVALLASSLFKETSTW